MRGPGKKKCLCFLMLMLLVMSLVLYGKVHYGFTLLSLTEYQQESSMTNAKRNWLDYLMFFRSQIEQNVTKSCSPAVNIAFIKTHKTGSSTVANILMRFGIVNDLNFALPNTQWNSFGFNSISRAGEVLTRKFIYPLPAGEEYNILCNHAIYNRTAFRMIMPDNTVYITILREPFHQFVSTYDYYKVEQTIIKLDSSILNTSNVMSSFLAGPTQFLGNTTLFSYTRNRQAEDLGFGEEQFFSNESLLNYVSSIERDFKLVMILEYFDESLLLLKHELCWTLQDILYIPLNANKKKPVRNFTEDDYKNHRRMSHVDYALYYYFLKVFTRKLDAQSPDFFRELTHFKKILGDVKETCEAGSLLTVAETRWNAQFVVDSHDCELLGMSVISGLDLLYKRIRRPENSKTDSVIVHQAGIII